MIMANAYFFRSVLMFTILLFSSFSPVIVIRHDKKDKEYLELAKRFPFVCKIGKRTGDGTLIASQWVITAAHVALGSILRGGSENKVYFEGAPNGYEVDSVFIHPDFQPMGSHDIALIKLKKPLDNILPAQLYRMSNENRTNIFIVGHGDFKTGKEKEWIVDGKKRAATNRVDKVTEDQIEFRFDAPDDANCTNLEGTAGRGDSGGPAIIEANNKFFVAGISSAGAPGEYGPGTYGAREHYTRVSTHIAWIESVLSGKVSPNKAGVTQDNPNQFNQEPAVLDGLGLILSQGQNKIMIEGKIDPEVPREFRDVIFGASSYIVSLNAKKYESLDIFSKDFKALEKGEKYKIVFSIKGQEREFHSIR